MITLMVPQMFFQIEKINEQKFKIYMPAAFQIKRAVPLRVSIRILFSLCCRVDTSVITQHIWCCLLYAQEVVVMLDQFISKRWGEGCSTECVPPEYPHDLLDID